MNEYHCIGYFHEFEKISAKIFTQNFALAEFPPRKVVDSDLTRLFLKLAGCEIDLDILEFVSSAVDFEFEKNSL